VRNVKEATVTNTAKAVAILSALILSAPTTASAAKVKNVAVVETVVDEQSDAYKELTRAEVRQITAELRRVTVNNLPREKYNVMTQETVQSQGGAVLERCAGENCVIKLGETIGAEYIVKGTISKFRTRFTLSVEMYETNNGNLVAALSNPVRSASVDDLLEKTAAACAEMYKKFEAAQNPTAQNTIPKQPATNAVADTQNPAPKPRGTSVTIGSHVIELVYVVGGTFVMGCTGEQGRDCKSNEEPAHRVTVSDFFIGKYEVTQGLWKAVMGNLPQMVYSKSGLGDNYPVYGVSWEGTKIFIDSLNRKTGRTFRLPTEAEWEYAARGGNNSGGNKYSGGNNIIDVAWHSKNSGGTSRPVGTKWPNKLEIHDMSGNVREWVSDIYEKDYYSRSSTINPIGPPSSKSNYRVYRGGGWKDDAEDCRVSYRNSSNPEGRKIRNLDAFGEVEEEIDPFINKNGIGFRLVLSP
jgi:formylglycine-generating enzyme required for sulfatase activity/TolB-like protein